MNRLISRRYISNFILFILSVGMVILLGELLLRTIWYQPLYAFEKGAFAPSEDYGYFLTPNMTSVYGQPEYSYILKANSYGFRGKEPNFNADFRVLILGDSVGMGQGVKEEDGLCSLSQAYFDGQGIDVDIFNTSVTGYTIVNELGVLRKWIYLYEPHLVVFLMHWNDINDQKSLFVKNGYIVDDFEKKFILVRAWLNRNSRLYCLVKRAYYTLILMSCEKEHIKAKEDDMLSAVKLIDAMNRICNGSKTRFITVLTPSMYIHPPSKDLFFDLLKENSITAIDWSYKMPEQNMDEFFYIIDNHPNAKGHALLSDYLNSLIYREMENFIEKG